MNCSKCNKNKNEILECKNDDCSYNVIPLLRSRALMSLWYMGTGVMFAYWLYIPSWIKSNNLITTPITYWVISAFTYIIGTWGVIIILGSIYMFIMTYVDSFIIQDKKTGKERKVYRF